jgi:hypothetical protein
MVQQFNDLRFRVVCSLGSVGRLREAGFVKCRGGHFDHPVEVSSDPCSTVN